MAVENKRVGEIVFGQETPDSADSLSRVPWLLGLLSVDFDKTTAILTRPLGNNNTPTNDGAC